MVFVAIYGVITFLQAFTMFINVKLWFNFSILAVFIVFRVVSILIMTIALFTENGNQMLFGFWIMTELIYFCIYGIYSLVKLVKLTSTELTKSAN